MPFAAMQTDLEIVLLSEVSQTEKEKYDTAYMQNLKTNDTNELIYKTDSQIYRTNLKLSGGRLGRKDSWGMCD